MGDMGRNTRAYGNEEMPKSLEKLLTVNDESACTPSTSAVPKSQLLAKLDAFLPQLKAANKALFSEDNDKINSIPAPVIVKPTAESAICEEANGENKAEEWSAQHADSNDDEPVVHMDVYVNDQLGELVADADSEDDDAEETENPLIEVVEDKNEGRNNL